MKTVPQKFTVLSRSISRPRLLAVLCLTACGLSTAGAFAASGQFTYVTGEVFVESGGRRVTATRGMEVNPGDVVVSGADGMAQLSMIDQAKLSLRSNSQLKIESYQRKAGDQDGAVLSLLRGTLRTFTGLLSPSNREKYLMKTRVATVGIRGSGNILSHEENDNCRPGGSDDCGITINHTIEGSHVVRSLIGNFAPIITVPNETVRVEIGKPPEKIPTPPAILSASNTIVGKEAPAQVAQQQTASTTNTTTNTTTNSNQAAAPTGTGGSSSSNNSAPTVPVVTVPTVSPVPDPSGLRTVLTAGNGFTYSGQALPSGLTLEGGAVRSFTDAPGGAGGSVSVAGGSATGVQTFDLGNNTSMTIGRWTSPTSVSFAGVGSFNGATGTTHFAYGSAGYPPYLSDVLTGTATYTQVGATAPTNQSGVSGSVTSSTLNVNFSQRTLNAVINISMPFGTTPTTYTISGNNLGFTLNGFYALTGFSGLTIVNNNIGSSSSSAIFGNLEGYFVGATLNGLIVGYGFYDFSTPTSQQRVNGVIAYQGPAQNVAAPFRVGLISDPTGSLSQSTGSQVYVSILRGDEGNIDANGQAITFTGPFAQSDGSILLRTNYARSTAQALDVGFDASTGLSWGRWGNGSATVGGVDNTALGGRSMHYIFSAAQVGPTTLPLTGTAVYDVIGSTRPTDNVGGTGTLNSATLNANFSNRTVDTGVNLTIAGQTWNASATGVPITRDMFFSVNNGGALAAGLPTPPQLIITCTPSCGVNARGSIDGFFTGRTGQGAGMMYSINNSIQGAVALRRRGG